MTPGKIYLLPSPISDSDPDFFLPCGLINIISMLDLFFVENIRTTRRFFSRLGIKDIDSIRFEVLNKKTNDSDVSNYISLIKNGASAGILSEAGCPGIADPGSKLIRIAHQNNFSIVPVTGPSSIFLALMASGFNGQNFLFHGYLPIDKASRKRKLIDLENMAIRFDQTQIFMETPYRNNQMLAGILDSLNNDTMLCIATDITGPDEFIKSQKILKWKEKKVDLHKRPTIFLLFHG